MRRRLTPRRLATSLAFATLFFTGASFSAVAGNGVVELLESDNEVALTEALPAAQHEAEAEAAPAAEPVEAAPVEEEPAPDARAVPSGHVDVVVAEPAPPLEAAPAEAPAEAPAPEAAPEPAVPAEVAPAAEASETDDLPVRTSEQVREAVTRARPAASKTHAARRAVGGKAPAPARPQEPHAQLDPEASEPSSIATVWLHRVLPDPTPASLRLAPETAARIRRAARGARVDWALVLGAVRADGSRGRVPARHATLAETAGRLADLGARRDRWAAALASSRRTATVDPAVARADYYRKQSWAASLALTGRTGAADRAVALANYYRAVGLRSLVDGLLARQDYLAAKVLEDERVDIYAAGREDIEAGRVDVRVLALIAYLAESHGQVTVSSLFSGHRLYSRPGVVSAHIYGQAVDISALGERSIWGNQEPGGLTEQAVRDILLLPAEMRPRQVISLLGLGGPSFPLADHGDHIHVGY